MKFMMIGKANKDTEAGVMPSEEDFAAMARYNEELVNAGVLVDFVGLQPSSKGARVRFSANGQVTVTDGPFAETKELIAGYIIINVKSRDEAIAWATRAPRNATQDHEVEIRQIFEAQDFAPSDGLEMNKAVREKLADSKKSSAPRA